MRDIHESQSVSLRDESLAHGRYSSPQAQPVGDTINRL